MGSYSATASADAILFSTGPTLNYGANTLLYIGQNVIGSYLRPVFYFDLSSVTAGSTITSATLTVNVSAVTGGAVTPSLRRLTTGPFAEGAGTGQAVNGCNWTRYGLTSGNWTTAGGDYVADVMASQTISTTGVKTFNLDNTQMEAMLANNLGFLMVEGGASANFLTLWSREQASNKPTLAFTWNAPAKIFSGLTIIGMG